MAKITWKAGTILAPVPPAMVSCGTLDKPNILTIAWTGIINSEPPMTYISVRKERFSHNIIAQNKEFVINLPNLAMATACDFCGVKSGRVVDKFKEIGLTAAACSKVSAPQILEAPVSLECKVLSVTELPSHDMFMAEIVAVNVDDKYMDDKGKLWLEKAGLLAYVHGGYYTLGRYLGKFGFSVEKKKKPNKRKA
ncbi:MAG: flavin reductase family protein [Alphaproteobacteria bacterium]|nr:flavin reductase family protein [Alphaproteobacteria bacterium]